MLRCLVAAGSNALRRAAMRPRGDGALFGSVRTPHFIDSLSNTQTTNYPITPQTGGGA